MTVVVIARTEHSHERVLAKYSKKLASDGEAGLLLVDVCEYHMALVLFEVFRTYCPVFRS